MQDEGASSLLARVGRGALEASRAAARHLGRLLAATWRVAKPVLRSALGFLLALIIVFEEWGWRPLAALLGRLARWRPWAAVESVIIRLPPYLALVVFVLPSALLLPLKFLALLLIAKGQIVLASLLFVAAKVVATALIARLFMLTQPALMQIGWFARGYDTLVPLKDALVARVHASWAWRAGRVMKERGRRLAAAQWRRWRPAALELATAMRASLARARTGTRRLLREMRERWATFRSSL
jgi:hypothetical protein